MSFRQCLARLVALAHRPLLRASSCRRVSAGGQFVRPCSEAPHLWHVNRDSSGLSVRLCASVPVCRSACLRVCVCASVSVSVSVSVSASVSVSTNVRAPRRQRSQDPQRPTHASVARQSHSLQWPPTCICGKSSSQSLRLGLCDFRAARLLDSWQSCSKDRASHVSLVLHKIARPPLACLQAYFRRGYTTVAQMKIGCQQWSGKAGGGLRLRV